MDDGLTVLMPPSLYEQRLLQFQFALIGRIFLPPGTAPRSNEDFKSELSKAFQTTGDWTLLHLGKGFFSLQFRLQEDQLRAARRNSWRLSSGSIHLREWKPNFDPYKETSSTAQIWVRLFHLPAEYWHPEFLVGIFRAVGYVIKLDGNTAQGLVGHFARALVEVDLSKPLLDSVRVGLPDNLFFVDFSYENIPLFCSFCHYIGHSIDQCRKAKVAPADGGENDEGKHKHDTALARKKKEWVEKEGEQQQSKRIVPVGTVIEKIEREKVATSNSFDALHNLDSGEETVPETQLNAGDIMEMVTGGSSLPQELTNQLLTAARNCEMNRQLRSECDAKNIAAQDSTSAAVSADSDSGEEMNQPSSTPDNNAAMDTSSDQNVAAWKASPAQVQATLQPSNLVAADLNVAALHRESMTGGEGISSPHPPSETQLETTSNNLVDPPPAQAKSITKRTKNKRKVTEVLPKRQLRSSTRNKSVSEITPEMIEAYARNQCQKTVQVPANLVGQSKVVQVAPNSPHPKRDPLEDRLRAAVELGQHPTAYVLDTGQSGALRAMDLVAKQQWGDLAHTEAFANSEDFSE